MAVQELPSHTAIWRKENTLDDQTVEVRGGPSVGLRRVAWTPIRDLDYHGWLLEGIRIGVICRASAWWIGDWLLYGMTRWGEQHVEGARVTDHDAKTLRSSRYVSSCFDLSSRRSNLTWSHHALLAALDPEEQCYWLDRAVADRLSVDDLQIELRALGRGAHSLSAASNQVGEHDAAICPRCGESVDVGAVVLKSKARRRSEQRKAREQKQTGSCGSSSNID